MNYFHNYLIQKSDAKWHSAIDSILSSIHKVDQNATQVWFRFYPLELFRYLELREDKEKALGGLIMQGHYALKEQIDTSHHFLYASRYWIDVKAAILAEAQFFDKENVDLADIIHQLAVVIGEKVKADVSLVLGITAVGLMTFVQTGLEAFLATSGDVEKPKGLMSKSPNAIVAARGKDDSQGLLGFLKTVNKKFSVIHDERRNMRFDIVNDQEIASASANDRSQNWQANDSRCWEGPVPVECTSASCGTCWVGVIAGEEKLSEVERRERRAIKVFGYDRTDAEKPLIRLACQAKAHGNVTIVIPPWNAVFGKKVYGDVEELELEPVTSSAKALREMVRETSADESSD